MPYEEIEYDINPILLKDMLAPRNNQVLTTSLLSPQGMWSVW